MAKRLLISLDDERYEDLRRLAFEKKTSMAELVRYAMEGRYEDELDAIRLRRRVDQHMRDPEGAVTLEEFMESQGIDVSAYSSTQRPSRARRAAS
jgi:hypothetical protein